MTDYLANIAATLKLRIRQAVRQQVGNAVLGGLALLFVGVALIAAIAAIGVLLADRWGVLAACLIIATVSMVAALLLVLAVSLRVKQARRAQRAEIDQWRQSLLAAKALAPDLFGGKALLIFMALGLLFGLKAGKSDPTDET